MEYKELKKLYYSKETEYQKEYKRRYDDPSTIHLDFVVSGNKAFFMQSREVVDLMIQILKLDKQVLVLCKELPGKALGQYSRKCLIDEIVLTNNIEGVNSSRKEIGEALSVLEEQSSKKGKKIRFIGMVNRYLKLMNRKRVRIETCQDIRTIYDEIVLQEVLLDDKTNAPDGLIFRKEQTTVRSATDKELHVGITPEKSIIEHMEKALRILNDESIEKLYRIAVFHYLLEYIHPFYDGNGRLGRFIVSYNIAETLESILAYRISETIKENVKWYYKAFDSCNDKKNMGDLTPFVIMMLAMIQKAEQQLIESLENKLDSWNSYESKVSALPLELNVNQRKLYSVLVQAALFSETGISMFELTGFLNSSEGTVRKYLGKIREQGLLTVNKIGRSMYYMIDTKALDEI